MSICCNWSPTFTSTPCGPICWSSHRAYLGDEQIPWLSSTALLARLSHKVKPARRLFTDFVLNQRGLGHRKEFHGAGCKDARVFGADVFLNEVLTRVEEMAPHRPDLATTLNLVADYFERNLDHLRLPGQ